MKKFLILLLLVSTFTVIKATQEDESKPAPQPIPGLVVKRISSGTSTIKRTPGVDISLILVVDEESVSLVVDRDYGIGDYLITDNSHVEVINGSIDTSVSRILTIPVHLSNNSYYEFSIVFEDGSYCYLTWN